MNRKIGRNDPCPCGSGKKYKNCCLGLFKNPYFKPPKAELGLLKSYFRNFNEKDLLATIGGLQLIPENDFHAVRLETAAKIACSIRKFGDKCINIDEFNQQLNRFLPTISDIGLREDPPEHLFTENIPFINGNNTVYPSIYHEENQILEYFLIVLNSFQEEFPHEFNNEIISRSLAILTLSNEIANRLKHTRYMDCPNDWTSKRENISFLPHDEFVSFKNAVIFQKEEIETIVPSINEVLKPFFFEIGDNKTQTLDLDKNYLTTSPLIDLNDEFVVLNPISLLYALRHNIIQTAIKYHIEQKFTNYYRNVLWSDSRKYLYSMGYDQFDYSFPTNAKSLPIEEGLFQIDSNKVAYVQLICDSAKDYDINNPKCEWNTTELIEIIRQRDLEIIDNLKENLTNYEDVFIIKVLGHIGRESVVKYQNIEQIRTLFITAENLKIISLSGNCDQLTLWKYVKAESDTDDYCDYISFSFLDKFAFYQENDTLINLIHLPKIVAIPVGFGKQLRLKVAQMHDSHLVPIGEHDTAIFAPVINSYQDSQIPIYELEEPVLNNFGYIVEGYYQPIWVLYYETIDAIEPETYLVAQDFLKKVAYWISQVAPTLREHLKNLGKNPIHIFIKFENIVNWSKFNESFFDQTIEEDSFHACISGRSLIFIIPDSFLYYIQGSDNSGDRILLNELLIGISHYIREKLDDYTLDERQICRIIEKYAPLGIKKQLFLFFAKSEGLLINNNLPELRLIQNYDINEQSLGITSELKEYNPSINLSKSEKKEICKNIVEIYLKRIKKLIAKYQCSDLLTLLIGLNESVLHNGKKIHVFAPYEIACFPHNSEYLKSMAKTVSKIDQTMLSIRTLIEMVIAEPPSGDKCSNIDDFDKMIALIHNFIDWATAADLYHHQILQSDLQYGEAGQIYLPTKDIGDKYSAFINEKTKEFVEGSYDLYKGEFDSNKYEYCTTDSDLSMKLDEALTAEFGFDINQLSRFFCCLIQSTELFICPEQNGPVFSLNMNEFKKRIKQVLNWTDQEVERALGEFSLKSRKSWEIPPKGYNFEADIAPWKFRRRLSHARRALLIVQEPKSDPIVMWGSLQSERSFKYIVELISSGRYDTSFSTPEMKSFIHEILRLKGADFTDFIDEWFKTNSSWFVKKNIDLPISKGIHQDIGDLGDIDVLAIDEKNGVIYSIECKNVNFGRNAREMANEIIRFYQGSHKEDSWISKHKKRHQWLKENYNAVINKFSRPSQQYVVRSLVITSEAIPSAYLHDFDLEIPIISFNQIERNGISVLEKEEWGYLSLGSES